MAEVLESRTQSDLLSPEVGCGIGHTFEVMLNLGEGDEGAELVGLGPQGTLFSYSTHGPIPMPLGGAGDVFADFGGSQSDLEPPARLPSLRGSYRSSSRVGVGRQSERRSVRPDLLKLRILWEITRHPGWDFIDLADALGARLSEVAPRVQQMLREGLLEFEE